MSSQEVGETLRHPNFNKSCQLSSTSINWSTVWRTVSSCNTFQVIHQVKLHLPLQIECWGISTRPKSLLVQLTNTFLERKNLTIHQNNEFLPSNSWRIPLAFSEWFFWCVFLPSVLTGFCGRSVKTTAWDATITTRQNSWEPLIIYLSGLPLKCLLDPEEKRNWLLKEKGNTLSYITILTTQYPIGCWDF